MAANDMCTQNEPLNIYKLLDAFKILGGNEMGQIDYKVLKFLLIQDGCMSEDDVASILNDESCKNGDFVDYMNLCISIISTKAIYNHLILENKKISRRDNINSRTFTRRKGGPHLSLSTDANGTNFSDHGLQNIYAQCLRGSFFNIRNISEVTGHRYSLEIYEASTVEIIAKAIDFSGGFTVSPSIEILVFLEHDESNKTLVGYSTFRNSEGYCTVHTVLKKGKYLLVPVVLNIEEHESAGDEEVDITSLMGSTAEGKVTLTTAGKAALRTIYDNIDLDGNGLLSQREFDLFIQHIAGESAADEWSTVEDNFEMENGQLTFEGFLSLYEMALEADPQDVISMLYKMGLNNSLQLDTAIPFLLTVNSEVKRSLLQPLPVVAFVPLVEKVLCKIATEQGECSKVRNMNDLALYVHKLPYRVTVAVQNQSHSNIVLRLDCSGSQNCVSHRKTLDYTVQVCSKSCAIGHHLFPVDFDQAWTIDCIETLIK